MLSSLSRAQLTVDIALTIGESQFMLSEVIIATDQCTGNWLTLAQDINKKVSLFAQQCFLLHA